LILLGDIKLWAIVRQHQGFKGQLLVVDDIAAHPPDHKALVADALKVYGLAVEAAESMPFLRRHALAGMAKARLAGRPSQADWSQLENHVIWANREGLMYERDLTRLHLGVLLLLHHRALDARRWLIPLAEVVMHAHRAPFEHDALFFASVACGESGSHRSALQYLNRYNAGIREQHLSRITVPPPNLEILGAASDGPAPSRRRGDSDREMVEHVLKRLRDAPQARLDSERMAQLAGVSRRTLENGFRRVTGLPPKEFTTRLRLAEFQRRKIASAPSGSAELELLARSVGFSSYRALARFERRIGAVEDEEVKAHDHVLD
jgi:AraC-like DNA-binding protein